MEKTNTYLTGRAFVKAASYGKIKQALRHPVRTSAEFFENEDKVFHKGDYGKRWYDPDNLIKS